MQFKLFTFISLLLLASFSSAFANEATDAGVKHKPVKKTAWSKINLPTSHMPYFFNSNKALRKRCLLDDSCPFKAEAENPKCWGYEANCTPDRQLFEPRCPGDSNGWTNNKQEQINKFWTQGDFGYVKERLSELRTYCKASKPGDSSLECVDHTRFCRGKNLYFDLSDTGISKSNDRYREDVIKPGHVGGYCTFDKPHFLLQSTHKSPLQSWYDELKFFTELKSNPLESGMCDVVFSEPTILIKLDAGVNMYHHFCDFINLYVTQHANNSFLQNTQIIFWDTSNNDYWSYFKDMWKVFSNKPPIHLKTLENKRVCFKDVVFSFLARMRYGLFYNMPLINGCQNTGLFKAFSEHSLHRFKVKQNGPLQDKVRVTFLARNTKFRNVLNEAEIVKTLKNKLKKDIELKVVTYDMSTSFVDQITQTYNSDIFMAMHGAGLTHLLFLPHWATVFEVYNCDDRDCYHDLARLRGVEYFTWEDESKVYPQDEGKHPQHGTPHKKFTNYSFDVDEFLRMVKKQVEYVRRHPEFIKARDRKYPRISDEL